MVLYRVWFYQRGNLKVRIQGDEFTARRINPFNVEGSWSGIWVAADV